MLKLILHFYNLNCFSFKYFRIFIINWFDLIWNIIVYKIKNNYPTLYVIQRWISGRRGLEPRCKPDLLPYYHLFYSHSLPVLRWVRFTPVSIRAVLRFILESWRVTGLSSYLNREFGCYVLRVVVVKLVISLTLKGEIANVT